MYLVFGTYISFRVSFPANVTCYKFCMLDKARKRHRLRVRVFLAKKRISSRSLFFAVFPASLPPFHPFLFFSLSLSVSISLVVPLLFPPSYPSSLHPYRYMSFSVGNDIATALPVVPKGIWNARDARRVPLQRRRGMLLQRDRWGPGDEAGKIRR